MKTSILVATIVACSLSTSMVSAQEKTAPATPAMHMDTDKQMPQMQENMKKMQQQMEILRTTTDPTERQTLMHAHMQTMQENMKSMRSMGGPMMKGEGEPSGMMMGGKKGGMMEGGDMMKHHAMMEKRMDMMQMMMEQMMQHNQVMEPMPAK